MMTMVMMVMLALFESNRVQTCRFVTKLVPKLSPVHQCTIVPRETCILKFSQPEQVTLIITV